MIVFSILITAFCFSTRSEIAVRKWVAGKVTPDINVQEKLAKHFHVPMKELFPQEACQEEILEEA